MVKVLFDLIQPSEDNPEGGLYLDGKLLKVLEGNRKIVMTSDTIERMIIFGDSGTGKSTIASQIAKFYDNTFTEERMCQSEVQFREQLEKMGKHQAIVIDEAFESLNSKESIKKAQILLTNLLQIIRQKNIFLIIVLPALWDLNKSVALSGSNWCMRTYTRLGKRGFFEAWNKDRKRELYIRGKALHNHKAVRPNFRGRFTKFMPINVEVYKQMKLDNLNRMLAQVEASEKKVKGDVGYIPPAKEQRDNAIRELFKQGKTREELATLFNLKHDTICKIIRGER